MPAPAARRVPTWRQRRSLGFAGAALSEERQRFSFYHAFSAHALQFLPYAAPRLSCFPIPSSLFPIPYFVGGTNTLATMSPPARAKAMSTALTPADSPVSKF